MDDEDYIKDFLEEKIVLIDKLMKDKEYQTDYWDSEELAINEKDPFKLVKQNLFSQKRILNYLFNTTIKQPIVKENDKFIILIGT